MTMQPSDDIHEKNIMQYNYYSLYNITEANVLQNQRDAIFQTQQKIRDEQRTNSTKPVNVLRQGLEDSQRTSAHLAGNQSNTPATTPVNNVLQNQRDAIAKTQQKIKDEQRANSTKPINTPATTPVNNVLQNQRDAIAKTQQKIKDEQRANSTKPVNNPATTPVNNASNVSNVSNASNTSNTSTNRSGLSLPSLRLGQQSQPSRKQKIMSNLSKFRTRSKHMFSRFRR